MGRNLAACPGNESRKFSPMAFEPGSILQFPPADHFPVTEGHLEGIHQVIVVDRRVHILHITPPIGQADHTRRISRDHPGLHPAVDPGNFRPAFPLAPDPPAGMAHGHINGVLAEPLPDLALEHQPLVRLAQRFKGRSPFFLFGPRLRRRTTGHSPGNQPQYHQRHPGFSPAGNATRSANWHDFFF